jgi:hypothetical protein
MFRLIILLLIVGVVAGLLGFPLISGAALTGAHFLIGAVLIFFLLLILGIGAMI